MNRNEIYIIIPAYNEEKVIGNVISELLSKGFNNLIVVNDGSKDNTSKIISHFPIIILEHLINRGQGAALGTGILFATKIHDCKYIVTFDADGQHRIEDVEKMTNMLIEKNYDIILGSRFLTVVNDKLPFGRSLMLKFGSLFLRFIYGLKLTDAHNGLRTFRKDVASKLIPSTDGMVHASEIIYLIKKYSLKYLECPVKINYTDYSISKGQRTSNFISLGLLTLYHKIILLFFEKD
jgi:polyprenyl-phospho-N-acetylgalactosaminyl synthase